MGEHVEHADLHPDAIRTFTKAILRDLGALDRMLRDGWIEEGVRRFGAEQELFLTGDGWRPAPLATHVLDRLGGEPFTTELALFNLEINLVPMALEGACFSGLEAELNRLIARVRRAARDEGGDIVLSGTLPTLAKSDLALEQITPNPRYYTLNEAMNRLRGEDYHLRIEGTDELITRHDSVMLEACNTSCQVHLQVGAQEFARVYNTAQLAIAPVLAVSANSPLLFGRRLWAETRIPIFQQSVDTRSTAPFVRDRTARVHFGDRWVTGSAAELFEEDLTRFKVLMAGPVDEDPIERLDAGEAPPLHALQLYNSTIYRWNRPCYGVLNGRPHLRIECRALPSGPSVVDEVANAAFWLGLVLGALDEYGDPARHMDFADVKSNFLAAARDGLHAGLRWVDGETVAAPRLIRDVLVPLAHRGLAAAGVAEADAERYLGIVADRAASGQNGADWTLRSLAGMEGRGSMAERLAALTGAMVRRQEPGAPVHEWSLARLDEAGEWVQAYLRVEQYMITDPVTMNADELVDLAAFVMERERVRHIAVEDGQHRLVGIVSYRSLLRMIAEHRGGGGEAVPVREFMEKDPITVSPDTSTLDAINLMREHGVSCLPVVRDDKLVGLVSERDFMRIAYDLLEERLRNA